MVHDRIAGGVLAVVLASACASSSLEREARAFDSPAESTLQDTSVKQDATQQPTEPTAKVAEEPAVQEPLADTRPQPVATKPPSWVHGSFWLRFRGRSSGGDHDRDVGGLLALDIADPNSPGGVTGHLEGRVDIDVDGSGSNKFGELSDTYDGSVVSKLYLAYAEIPLSGNGEASPGTFRVGRQTDSRLPEVLRLDGVSYLTRPMGNNEIELGAYGGVPVHLYDSSRQGDRAFGTFVEGRPWQGGRARVDWMHLEDEDVLGAGKDDLLALGLWEDFDERLRLEGDYTRLEGHPRDLRLRALFDDAESETNVRVSYYALLETQKALATELDPFFEQLLDYFPYSQTSLNASHVFGEHVALDLGFDMRRVTDSSDVGEFNREWERYYATGTYNDLGTKGLALSATIDRWDDDDRDTSSFGADLSYDRDERWKGSIGTFYSLYKYSFLELDERDDVRTYYLRAAYDVSKQTQLEFRYEFENDDLDTYNTLYMRVRWQF